VINTVNVVEKISKKQSIVRNEVARVAVRLAVEGGSSAGGDDRAKHVGYYLIDKGFDRFRMLAGARLSFPETIRK